MAQHDMRDHDALVVDEALVDDFADALDGNADTTLRQPTRKPFPPTGEKGWG